MWTLIHYHTVISSKLELPPDFAIWQDRKDPRQLVLLQLLASAPGLCVMKFHLLMGDAESRCSIMKLPQLPVFANISELILMGESVALLVVGSGNNTFARTIFYNN